MCVTKSGPLPIWTGESGPAPGVQTSYKAGEGEDSFTPP